MALWRFSHAVGDGENAEAPEVIQRCNHIGGVMDLKVTITRVFKFIHDTSFPVEIYRWVCLLVHRI